MHQNEVRANERTARRLIDAQFPQWRDEPIRAVCGAGTVNAIFRIGDHHAARFPLEMSAPDDGRTVLVREAAAMSELAGVCPVATPLPVAIGAPGAGYPTAWAVQTWVAGETATPEDAAHSHEFAKDLAHLVCVLREADTRGLSFSGSGRGGDLKDSDEWIELCLLRSEGLLPVDELREMWRVFRELPGSGRVVMTHGDLTPANLVLAGERLVGVLDGGGFAPADPALDLIVGWHLLGSEARAVFRRGVGGSDLEWQRGAAWAFQQAMGLVWYYAVSNPEMSALGRSTLTRLLSARS